MLSLNIVIDGIKNTYVEGRIIAVEMKSLKYPSRSRLLNQSISGETSNDRDHYKEAGIDDRNATLCYALSLRAHSIILVANLSYNPISVLSKQTTLPRGT